jgi:hypothetical protein
VESSVKTVRNEVYALRYRFDTLEDAEKYLEEELNRMNAGSEIDEEKKFLLPWRPPLEVSRMTEQRVDKYSFIRVENNYYSVPEYLVGRKVTVRNYIKDIVVYSGLNEVCRHKKKDGFGEMSVNIFHYLDTLTKKPGAVRNSKALRSVVELKSVFDLYYTSHARDFIDILRSNQDKPMGEVVRILQLRGINRAVACPGAAYANVLWHTASQLSSLSDFFMRGGAGHVH